ncbi:hypothetical protein STEG23_031406 [Scotinomys teguina]
MSITTMTDQEPLVVTGLCIYDYTDGKGHGGAASLSFKDSISCTHGERTSQDNQLLVYRRAWSQSRKWVQALNRVLTASSPPPHAMPKQALLWKEGEKRNVYLILKSWQPQIGDPCHIHTCTPTTVQRMFYGTQTPTWICEWICCLPPQSDDIRFFYDCDERAGDERDCDERACDERDCDERDCDECDCDECDCDERDCDERA